MKCTWIEGLGRAITGYVFAADICGAIFEALVGNEPRREALKGLIAVLALNENSNTPSDPQDVELVAKAATTCLEDIDVQQIGYLPPTVFRSIQRHLGTERFSALLAENGWRLGKCPCGKCDKEKTAVKRRKGRR